MKWFPRKLAGLVGKRPRWLPSKSNPTFTKSTTPLVQTGTSATGRPHYGGGAILAGVKAAGMLGRTGRHLRQVTDFGSNPGGLRMYEYAPVELSAEAPLIVILHGCNQNAEDYATGSGWIDFARSYGAALLLPEQRMRNNPTMCFNWYQRADAIRDSGEALSIKQMIERMSDLYDIDRKKIFVTGLSAGGAMATAMLAAYPEIFAGGAVLAGLPFGAANNMSEAFAAMGGPVRRSGPEWGQMVRDASSHDGPWPRLIIWHGSRDRTVSPANALALEQQWRHLHDLDEDAMRQLTSGDITHRAWHNNTGTGTTIQPVVETLIIDGMDHGVPIDPNGQSGVATGASGPFMLDVGLSSTQRIAEFWGLTKDKKQSRRWLS